MNDLIKIIADLTDEGIRNKDFGTYTAADYFDNMARVTRFQYDPDLVEFVIQNCFDTLVVATWRALSGARIQQCGSKR